VIETEENIICNTETNVIKDHYLQNDKADKLLKIVEYPNMSK